MNVNIELKDVQQRYLISKHLILNITDISNNRLLHCININLDDYLLENLKKSFSDSHRIILINDKIDGYNICDRCETKSKKYLSLTDNILVFKIMSGYDTLDDEYYIKLKYIVNNRDEFINQLKDIVLSIR